MFPKLSPVILCCITITHHCVVSYAMGREIHNLTASDGTAPALFGHTAAIEGHIAVIGAPIQQNSDVNTGRAYVFDLQSGAELDSFDAGDDVGTGFGVAVAMDGPLALIGAHRGFDDETRAGSAYTFDLNTGLRVSKLVPSDGASEDAFGSSVALQGTTALVGAREDDDLGRNSGSAFLYNAQTGEQLLKLTADDGNVDDFFGSSVALVGTTALVGSPSDDDAGGSVYMFDTTTGEQFKKISADDALQTFGASLASYGDMVVVGAPGADGIAVGTGAAYVVKVSTGEIVRKLIAEDGMFGDQFGNSVDIFGSTAIVGAKFDDDTDATTGSAYLFSVITGQQIAKLTASDALVRDEFGRGVAIGGSFAVAGAPGNDDIGSSTGSAYVFQIPEPTTPTLAIIAVLILARVPFRR